MEINAWKLCTPLQTLYFQENIEEILLVLFTWEDISHKMPDINTTGRFLFFEELIKMPKFLIEREIPGAGMLSTEQLQAISQKSCGILSGMGPKIQWLESYVTDDKVYCVYIAPDEASVKQHAEQGGFPANKISRIKSIIDPTTAEG